MRAVKNNSGFWRQRKTTQVRLENENSEPQMWNKHGHLAISAVCRKRKCFVLLDPIRIYFNIKNINMPGIKDFGFVPIGSH